MPTSMCGGWAADNKGCCSGWKLGCFDWEMLQAAGSWSYPAYYAATADLRLMAAEVRRERGALPGAGGAGWMLLPTITPRGANAFAGGDLRSERLFDVQIQLFASGATGLSIFEDPYTDEMIRSEEAAAS